MSNFMVTSGAKFCLTLVKQMPFHPCVNL